MADLNVSLVVAASGVDAEERLPVGSSTAVNEGDAAHAFRPERMRHVDNIEFPVSLRLENGEAIRPLNTKMTSTSQLPPTSEASRARGTVHCPPRRSVTQ